MGIKVALEKIGVHAVFENVTDSSVCNPNVKIVANGQEVWVYNNVRKLKKLSKSGDLEADELRDDAVQAVREVFMEKVVEEKVVEEKEKVVESNDDTKFSSDMFSSTDF
jgi:hypothetical protein